MSDRWPKPCSQVTVLSALGTELERAAARPRRRRVSLRGGRRGMAIAVAALLCMGGAALAATGVLSPVVTIPAGRPSGPPENRKAVAQTVLAEGTAPVAGPWRITTYGSEGVTDDGAVLEPRGLPCIELSLTAPPRTPLLASSYCGRQLDTDFTVGSLPVKEQGGGAQLLLFGTVPEQAALVTFVADDSARITVRVLDRPAGRATDVWATAVPPGFEHAEVQWRTADGSPGGPSRDVSDALGQLERLRRGLP